MASENVRYHYDVITATNQSGAAISQVLQHQDLFTWTCSSGVMPKILNQRSTASELNIRNDRALRSQELTVGRCGADEFWS